MKRRFSNLRSSNRRSTLYLILLFQKENELSEKYNLNNEYTVEILRLRQICSDLVELKGSLKTSKDVEV